MSRVFFSLPRVAAGGAFPMRPAEYSMSNQRPSFAKRDREMRLKDKARQKAERRAARKVDGGRGEGGPPTDPLVFEGLQGEAAAAARAAAGFPASAPAPAPAPAAPAAAAPAPAPSASAAPKSAQPAPARTATRRQGGA